MKISKKIIWSEERQKWLCYDDTLIDNVLCSKDFKVPSYDYSAIENKFKKNLEFTKKIIENFPLANEGGNHQFLRNKMLLDINQYQKKALLIFRVSFQDKLSKLNGQGGIVNFADLVIDPILESNWAFANITIHKKIDYSDLTLILDDSQSIKSRLKREDLIKYIALNMNEQDLFYKLALISVGVNALISTTLQSFIKILVNHSFHTLINQKFFYANGIRHLERICTRNCTLGDEEILVGQKLRLFVENYESGKYDSLEKNKKFFGFGSPHACIGMAYSLNIWKELIQHIRNNFTNLQIISYDYRPNDAIFNFPTNIVTEYSK